MKRSKTSEHTQTNTNLGTTRVSVLDRKISMQLRSGGSSSQALHKAASTVESKTTNPTSTSGCSIVISDIKLGEVSKIAEERRKDRLKALTRNLEVCDLLDMRNV